MPVHSMKSRPSTPTRPTTQTSLHRRRPRLLAALAAAAGTLVMAVVTGLGGPVAAQSPPAVTIEKATNGVDADAAPGPAVEPGQAVTWTWTVSSVGAEALYDLVVSDSSGVRPNCDVNGDDQPDGTNIHPGPLEPGQSFRCTGSGAADHGAADGTFAATGPSREDDPSHHHVSAPYSPAPSLAIRALVSGQVAQGPNGPLVAEDQADTVSYVVTNTGNTPVTGIEVSDEAGLSVDCGGGSSVIAGPVAPGGSVTCTASIPSADVATGQQARTGSAVGSAIHPSTGASVGQVSASDAVTFTTVQAPTRLAFTGPGSFVLPLGLALTGLGSALLLLARRRAPVQVCDAALGSDAL